MHTNSHVESFPLIGLAAKAQSGKSTVARFLADFDYTELSFAEPIRKFVAELVGVSREDLEKPEIKETVIPWVGQSPRQMMQTLGTQWGRELVREDFWIRRAMTAVERVNRAVISDVRFDNEAQAIRDAGGVVVHLVRPDALVVAAHASEQGVTRDPRDYVIVNDGTLGELFEKTHDMMYSFWKANNP